MAKTYKSEALAALHESMSDLHQAGAIDNKTMREFDSACLTPVIELSPAAIRRIRAKAAVSQAVFAAHLNEPTGFVLDSAAKHGL
jgi:putative transcriptional regulator